jgi:hypothetical protein
MKTYKYEAVIQKADGLNACYVEFPYSVEKEFGVKGQVKVKATFDGYEYRGSLTKMGHVCHLIGLTKEVRKAIGKNPGDKVKVTITKDTEERTVEVPEDLNKLLKKNKVVKEYFDQLSYSHRKEYVVWINDCKKEETRQKRIQKCIAVLSEKMKLNKKNK